MKALFNLFIVLLSVSILQAQTVKVESNKLVITGSNKLGVGVTNPLAAIDVNGGIKLGTSSSLHAGVMRFHAGQFEGFTGSTWKSLSTEVDGSISNELISSITFSGNNLQINENGNIKSVNLLTLNGPFERNGTVVRQTGNYTTDDFIIGRDELPQPSQTYSDNLLFFDKSKGAIRAGRIQSSQNWVADSIGFRSAAFGFNSLAKGGNSFAIGQSTKANGSDSFCGGTSSTSDGLGSFSFGKSNEAMGDYSSAFGSNTISQSFAEIAIGYYNTDYTANDLNSWDEDDRLFVIGSGSISFRKDALALWKNGQLGLGESNPDARLHVKADIGEDIAEFYIGAKREFYIQSDGQIGIGDIVNPDAKLYVEASASEDLFRVRSDGTTKFKVNQNGGIRNSNATATYAFQLQNSSTEILGRGQAYSWNTFSDMRIKSNITPIAYGLDQIMSLQPKSYDHHDSEYFEDGRVILKGNRTTKDIGLLAQEAYEIIPEAVSRPSTEGDLWSMDYTRLVPVLIKSIQEQQEMINILNAQLKKQQTQIDLLTKIQLDKD